MFGKDKKIANEKVLYEARPSFILSCTSVFIAVIVLGILFYAYTEGIKMIGGMGMYLIDSVKMPITSYYALAILILMIFTFLYMVWKVLSWATVRYTITSYRVIVKKGILTENKTYMPFNTIQDVNLSQNILGKLISVGTLSLYSAYDGKNVELKNIFSPDKVEDIIFKNMRTASHQPRSYYSDDNYNNYNNPNNYNNQNNMNSNLAKSGGLLSRFSKKKEEHAPVRNYGNIYDNHNNPNNYGYNNPNYNGYNDSPNYDEIVPEHNHARSDAPINDIDDLDDLELVDVNARKKELRNLRRQAKAQNNRKHYNKSNYHNNHSNYNNYNSPNNYNNPNYNNHSNYNGPNNQYNQYDNYEPSNYNPNRVGGCLPEDWENDGYNDYNNYVDYVAGPSYYNNQERNATTNNQYNQNQNQYNQNQDYADVYIQDAQDGVTYEPIHNDSIRDSYKRNPDKYFAENYEKFQEDNLKSQVREANNSANNSNNKNIMFRDQKPKSYDNNLANEFVSDVPNTYNDPNNQYNNPNNYNNYNNYNNSDYNNQPNYNPNYGLDDYKKEYANNPQYSDNRNDMNYNDSNYSDYRNNQNRGYNKNYNGNKKYNSNKKYNPNKRYNKNKKYNKYNKHNKHNKYNKHNNYNNHNSYNNHNGPNNHNNQYNNQYNHDNYNHNNDYGDYGHGYDSGDNLDLKNNKRTAKDVIKNHSKKFER